MLFRSAEPSQHAFEHAVCLGGTFDYLHTGHKLLLSMGALACGVNARLVVGVSDAPLLRKKVLREMMQPLPLRLALVADFVNAVAPHLRLELTALQDGYGPAGSDAELQAIVVSAESLPGGHACNAKRTEGGLPPLEVLCLPLVDEAGEGGEVSEEAKLSSSSVRKARLAVLQRGDETTWARVTPPGTPYVVGLTGGIASGKSTVARHLARPWGPPASTATSSRTRPTHPVPPPAPLWSLPLARRSSERAAPLTNLSSKRRFGKSF